jgi:hypothetical protein
MGELGKPPQYQSYLLTFWEERGRDRDGPVEWRFRLENVGTGQRRGFASLEEMVVFLRQELNNS